mmetsp:Transcript_44006/g.103469  ORF Transcript_44006/g.103469 Transcript_44006/m.103469 type:complete len:104 (-) Transcript_44006:889-1200(-)
MKRKSKKQPRKSGKPQSPRTTRNAPKFVVSRMPFQRRRNSQGNRNARVVTFVAIFGRQQAGGRQLATFECHNLATPTATHVTTENAGRKRVMLEMAAKCRDNR